MNNYNNTLANETINIINLTEKKFDTGNKINDILIVNNIILNKTPASPLLKFSSFQIFNQKLLEYQNNLRATHLFTYDIQINSLSSIINRIAGFYLFLLPLYFYLLINIIPIEYYFYTSRVIDNCFIVLIIACFHLCLYLLIYHILRILVEKNLENLLISINHMQQKLKNIFFYSLLISFILTFSFCFIIL